MDYYESLISDGELEHLKGVLKPHELFWLHTPSIDEIKENTCDVQNNVKEQCMEWVKDILKPNLISSDMKDKLIPMKKWWRPNDKYLEKGGSDVFITQFTTGTLIIRLIENSDRVVIITKDLKNKMLIRSPESYIKFIQLYATSILNNRILAKKVSQHNKIYESNDTWAKGAWVPSDNFKAGGGSSHSRESIAFLIEYWTNGEIIIFNIYKCTDGPRMWLEPYVNRFK